MQKVCDCFPALKEVTAAREQRYRSRPEAKAPEGPQSYVEVKVTSIGQLNERVECKRSGFEFVISEPVHVGGQNVAPSPLEFLLSGAVGCYAAVFAFYAAKLGVSYESFEAVARTTMDGARPHDARCAAERLPEGHDRHRRGERCAARRTAGGRAAGAAGLPGHQHLARSGAGGEPDQPAGGESGERVMHCRPPRKRRTQYIISSTRRPARRPTISASRSR
jgi:hypothetical protein